MKFWDRITDPERLNQVFWAWGNDRFAQHSFGDELMNARHVAAGLKRRGVRAGDFVPAVLTNGPDATPGFGGIWAAGATVASLPIIARGMSIEHYVTQLERLCDLVEAPFFLAEERFLQFMPPESALAGRAVGYRELIETPSLADFTPPEAGSTVFVQFSSGTTGEPRGVRLTAEAIDAQMSMLMERLSIDPRRDIGYMWLPLSHDMGFFGCSLLALYSGMRGVRATPERFLRSPQTWFDDCAEFGATVTAGPPSALQIATRAAQVDTVSSQRLEKLRLCLVGAETVEWDVLAAATATFAQRGLRADAFTVAYGLAEATLGVSIGTSGERTRYLDIEDDDGTRRVVSTGRLLRGTHVEINPDGEIVVRSPSLAEGYLGASRATAERFCDGAVRTGDIGFLHDDELYVLGRTDDVLIVGGRNVPVQGLEQELGTLVGVRAGNCAVVAFRDGAGAGGKARIAVVAEGTKETQEDQHALARQIRRIAIERSGLPVDRVVLVARGMFPKTPSGKAQRYRCRELARQSSLRQGAPG